MPRISRGPSTASDTDPSAVLRALSLMRSQASEPLTLRDLADAAYASPFHFLRTFRRATGLSPGRFLGALRLKSAVRLLMTTDLPVTEVCFASGYNSLGTFTRRFTEVMGLPPTLLRRGAGGAGAAGELRGRPPLPVAARPPAARTPTRPEGTAVRGSLHLSEEAEASAAEIYFVALFTAHYPQGIPVACTLLTAPGPFVLPPVPNGAFHLLAAAVTDPAAVWQSFLGDQLDLVGGSIQIPIEVADGKVTGATDLALRRPRPTDPPLLACLPLLFADRGRAVGLDD